MSIEPLLGRPKIGSERLVSHRVVSRQGFWDFLANGLVIDGSKSRDPGNTDDDNVLRPGLLMGKVTASGKYAPSVLGVTTGAIAATDTTVNVSAAVAAEIVRRIGSTGTLRFVGPPTANGTVATFTETYSAVNTTTGAITISAADAALVAGSFVCADDGSYLPVSLIPDGYGILIPEPSADVEWPLVPIGGVIDPAQVLPVWPSDTSLRTWVRTNLSTVSGGKFTFSDQF